MGILRILYIDGTKEEIKNIQCITYDKILGYLYYKTLTDKIDHGTLIEYKKIYIWTFTLENIM